MQSTTVLGRIYTSKAVKGLSVIVEYTPHWGANTLSASEDF